MKKLCHILLLGILTIPLAAQDRHVIDSLHRELKKDIPDSTKVNILLNGLAMEFYMSDPQTAMMYCDKALEISEKSNYPEGIGAASGWLAYLFEQQGMISKAIEYNLKSLEIMRAQNDLKQQASILNNLGAIYKDRGNIDEAIRYHNESLALREQINDTNGIATSYNNLGIIYSNQGNISQALDYYFKALKLEESHNNADGISTAWHNIGIVYKEQGDLKQAVTAFQRAYDIRLKANDKYGIGYSLNAFGGLYELYDSLNLALDYYNRAYAVRNEIQDRQGMAHTLKNIGVIYEKRQLPRAFDYFNKSFKLFEITDDKWGMTTVLIRLASGYKNSGNKQKAEEYATKAYSLANDLGYPSEIRDAAQVLRQIYSEKGLWKKAYDMSDVYYTMRDSIRNSETQKELFKQLYKYEYEKKEAALRAEQEKKMIVTAAELKTQKTQKYFYLSGFSLILLSSLLLFNRYRITRRQKSIIEQTLVQLKQAQQQLIESEKMAAFGIMASRMAHEIQNPLNFVNNFSDISNELLQEAEEGSNTKEVHLQLKECLSKIHFHGKRAETIVRKLQEHINAGTAHEFFTES